MSGGISEQFAKDKVKLLNFSVKKMVILSQILKLLIFFKLEKKFEIVFISRRYSFVVSRLLVIFVVKRDFGLVRFDLKVRKISKLVVIFVKIFIGKEKEISVVGQKVVGG